MKKRTIIHAIMAFAFIMMLNGCKDPGYSFRKTGRDKAETAVSEKKDSSSSKKKKDKKERIKQEEEVITEEAESTEAAETEAETETEPAPEEEERPREKTWEAHKNSFQDSSGFYRKLNKGEDVNVLINGDSIGAGGGSTPGNSWTDLLKAYIESEYSVSCNLKNISLGGNASYAGYVMESILDDDTDYDLIVFCYGENDGTATLAPEYEAMIRAARKKYVSCNMISVLESSQREYTKKMEAIEELSEYYDIEIADTIAKFNESGIAYEELTVDVKHPNDEGYRLYFETLKKIIEKETYLDTGVDNIERIPLRSDVSGYDSFRYFPAESFIRKDDLTFELELDKGISGIIGLYHVFCPVTGDIVIKTDGSECIRKPMEWSFDYRQDFIYNPDHSVHSAQKHIEISFPSVEMADGFKGLIFTGG